MHWRSLFPTDFLCQAKCHQRGFPRLVLAVAAAHALFFLRVALGAETGASQVDLRGYGKVLATFAPSRAEFTCESSEKAGILQDKLLEDLLWQATDEQRAGTVVDAGGIKPIVHDFPPFGAIVVGRLGERVLALGGSSLNEAAERAAKEEMFRDPRCQFRTGKAHPVYLDFFDLSAMKVFTYAMASIRGEGLSSHWPFLRKFGINAIAYSLGGGMLSAKSPDRGILNFVDTDYEVREAERNQGMIMPSISAGGALPVWALNLFPESVMKHSPTGIGLSEHTLHLVESYGMPPDEREATGLWCLRETMRRYGASPAVGGYKLYDGPAGIEAMHGYEEIVDFSESGLKSYREYLRDVKGFDLEAVGLRYYNDPNHFKSWDEVTPLDANGFFGNLDESCLVLKDWQWSRDGGSDAKWRNIPYPGSDQMHTIPDADAFYRISFDAGQWLAGNSSKDIHLVTAKTRAKKPARMKVWLNGKYLGEQGNWLQSHPRAGSVKVNGVLKPGLNELELWVPNGKLLSPFFLTTRQPEEYPSSDKTLNARYVDLKDWHDHRLIERHRDMMEAARSVEPNRPMIFTAGTGWDLADGIVEIANSMGASVQNTGREVYQPWWPRLGRVAGFYGSSEPGSTVTPDPSRPMSLDFMFGAILIDGDASHTLYWQLEDYIRIERETGWFTKNKRLLSLVGKSLPLPPEIVILRSSLTTRYWPPEGWSSPPFRWDLGRGEMNCAHYNWGYASEDVVRKGLPDTCKVLMDSGSEFMDQAAVDAIASFVEKGGSFIALHNTGRHDPVNANTWPISRLTGCKVAGQNGKGRIRFESDLPIMKGWEGREFEGEGSALDAGGNDHARDNSLRLVPESGDVKAVAKWADGTAAVTCRTLGIGRVICLGSTFWRSASDRGSGAWGADDSELQVLDRLFTDLGVERQSDASSSSIWLNDNITKNGIENWLISVNSTRVPVSADIRFRAAAKPQEVRELTMDQAVRFKYADGWIHLKGIKFDSVGTKVFAIKRAGLAGGIPYWWSEKTTYWKNSGVPEARDEVRDAGKLGTLKFDTWKFLPDRNGAVSAQNGWIAPRFDDASWDAIETGPWNSLKSELKDYAGIGLYRAAFTIPAEWKGSSVSLNLYGDRMPKVFGDAEFYLNGRKIEGEPFQRDLGQASYPARVVIDDLLAGPRNVLAVKIKGGAKWAGEDFSGFAGSVYLAAEKPMSQTIDLGGPWTIVRQDGSSSSIAFPGAAASGKYLAKDAAIPANWAGRQIYLKINAATPWLEGIMVNGRLLLPAQFRKMGTYAEWNVTQWVDPGKLLRVELWGKGLPLYEALDPKKPQTDSKMDLLSAKIGTVE